MNKKYKKMLAKGLALNMMLINIPYNVFANSDIEEIILNEENIPLINEGSESDLDDLVIKEEHNPKTEDLIIEEGNSDSINNEVTSELLEPAIEEDCSNIAEINTNENISNSTTNFTEDKKIAKSSIPSVINYADSFAGGNGSQENPYQISNALELARLAYLVNEEGLDTANIYFELIDDIDLEGFDVDNDDTNGNWIPIGIMNYDRSFKGTFNGADYKISNLNINKEYSHTGLFGVIENASIKNLQIENFTLNDVAYGGLLAGYAYGSVNIINIKGVSNKIINTNKTSFGIGGLIGSTSYLRFNSIHYINIENIDLEVKVSTVEKNGYTIGGIIGDVYSSNNINIDNVKLNFNLNGISTYAGGLIGYCYISDVDKNKNLNIKNVSINADFSDIENSNTNSSHTGGMIGYFSSGKNDFVFEIESIKIYFNSEIPQGVQDFSGLIAKIYNSTLNVRNVEIKGINNTDSYYSAGLIANFNSSSINIDNLSIEMDIFAKRYGGGLMTEVSSSSGDIYINNFNYKGKIVGTDTNANFRYGGVIADCDTSKNVKILNSTVDATIEFECMNYAGGLIGSLTNGDILIKNNTVDISIANCKYQTGGLIGYLSIKDNLSTEISQNEINLNIESNIYDSSKIGGIIGQISNRGTLNVSDNFVVGDIDAISNDRGYFSSIIDNNGEISVSNIYFVSDIDSKNSINDRYTYLYSELNGNEIEWNNIYYNSEVSNLSDTIAIPLITEEMQDINARENMPFDYDNIWKLNKKYYPTFEQLNTAPELSGSDIELILNQNYNLLDYVTIEDFEDMDLIPEVETDLDITKIGDYTAIYTVTDPQGLTDELTLNIRVVAERPIINATDLTLYIGDKFDPKEKVTAIDINGNDITEYIKVIENTVDTTKKGVYKVVYQVDSLERLTTTKEIKVTVLEKEVNNNNNSDNNKVESNKNESSTIDKPQTGDNFMVYGIALLVSLGGLLYINRKNTKN